MSNAARSRYRNALEDLAHSLKTPLAVVRNSLLDDAPDKALLGEQLNRMETATVTHQLSKASASGPVVVGRPVELSDPCQSHRPCTANRLSGTWYSGAGVGLDRGHRGRGDERDFMELMGNLVENRVQILPRPRACRSTTCGSWRYGCGGG